MEFSEIQESRYRAVYQYTAKRTDELNLNIGDVIEQVEVREGDGGWARGQLDGRFGYFPLNHASRISVGSPVSVSSSRRYYRVLHSYTSLRPGDLQLHVGAHVEFICEVEPGWWKGRIEDRVGVFPNNYVSDPLTAESPVVLRRNSRVKSFHASIDHNLGAPLSSSLFQPEDEPLGPLFGSISSQLDWSTASLSSYKAKGFLGRVRQSLSTKSLMPKFLRGRLSSSSLNDKSSIESSSFRRRRNSFASFFNKSSGKLQLSGSTSASKLGEDLMRLSLSGEKSKSPSRPTEQCRSWVWQQGPPGLDYHPSADSGVLDLDNTEEVFGPIQEVTDEVFEDMFDQGNDSVGKDKVGTSSSIQDSSNKSRLSRIMTSFSPFEKKLSSSGKRPSIATNPNVTWKPKYSDSEEIKVTEL